jgi:hypothetical protein
MATVTINNKDYDYDTLPESAKQQINNLQAVDAELSKLQQQLAIYQTARNAYAQALLAMVEGEPKSPAKKRTSRAKKTAE